METRQVPIIATMKRSNDETGVILGWFIRVGLVLAVLAVVLFDIGSIVVNSVGLSSSAEDVAIAVSITVADRSGAVILPDSVVYDLAVDVVESEANGVSGARVLRRGTEMDQEGIVYVRLRRRAETLVADLIGPLKKYTIATVSGQAGTN